MRQEKSKQFVVGGRQLGESKELQSFKVTGANLFDTVYTERNPQIRHIQSGELNLETNSPIPHKQSGVLEDMAVATPKKESEFGFFPQLGWSHYRALMRVENRNERLFHEIEAELEDVDVSHRAHREHGGNENEK